MWAKNPTQINITPTWPITTLAGCFERLFAALRKSGGLNATAFDDILHAKSLDHSGICEVKSRGENALIHPRRLRMKSPHFYSWNLTIQRC